MKFERGFQLQLIEGINAIESVIASSKNRSDQRTSAGGAYHYKGTVDTSGGGGQVGRVRCPSVRLYNQGPLSAPQYYHQYRVRASDSCKLPPNTTNQPPSTAITTGRQKARKACICKFSLLQVSSTKAKRPKFHIDKSASDKTN